MIIQPSSRLMLPVAPRSLATPSAAASVPVDSVTVAPSAAPLSWDDFERAGLVSATASTPGPVGHALAASARQGLLDAVTGLQRRGVSFERSRTLRVPGLMDKYVPASPDQVVDALAARKPGIVFNSPPTASGARETRVPMASFDDLRGLDGVYGAGPSSLSAHDRAAMEAVADLATGGRAVMPGSAARPGLAQPFEIWRIVHADGSVYTSGGLLLTPDELTAQAMLETGTNRGNPHDDILKGIVALRTGPRDTATELELYRRVRDGRTHRWKGTTPGSIAVTRADLANPAAVAERSRLLDELCRQYLAERLGGSINLHNVGEFDALYDHLIAPDQKFSPAVRASAIRSLYPAASNRHGYVELPFLLSLDRQLEEQSADELELKWRIRSYMGGLLGSGCNYPGEAQLEPAGGTPPMTAERQAITDKYRHLLAATASELAASDGLDLVRMPIGNETEDQRTDLFLALAAARNPGDRGDTARDYRALLQHRRPDQDLAEAARFYAGILKSLATCGQPSRAAEAFTALQGIAAETGADSDRITAAFGTALATDIGSDVLWGGALDLDRLLAATRRSLTSRRGANEGIRLDGDTVIIGGIRVRRGGAATPGEEAVPAQPREEAVAAQTREEAIPAQPREGAVPAQPRAEDVPEPAKIERADVERALADVLARAINGDRREFDLLYLHCLEPSRFSRQARIDTLRALVPLYFNHHGYLEVRDVLAGAKRLEERPNAEVELRWLTRQYVERAGAVKLGDGVDVSATESLDGYLSRGVEGGSDPDRFIEEADLSLASSQRESRRESEAALLRRLQRISDSRAAGSDAYGLLCIPVGSETQEQRVRLFEELTATCAPGARTAAVGDYRALLVYRKPCENLLEAGEAYLALRRAHKTHEATVEAFAARRGAPTDTLVLGGVPLKLGGVSCKEPVAETIR